MKLSDPVLLWSRRLNDLISWEQLQRTKWSCMWLVTYWSNFHSWTFTSPMLECCSPYSLSMASSRQTCSSKCEMSCSLRTTWPSSLQTSPSEEQRRQAQKTSRLRRDLQMGKQILLSLLEKPLTVAQQIHLNKPLIGLIKVPRPHEILMFVCLQKYTTMMGRHKLHCTHCCRLTTTAYNPMRLRWSVPGINFDWT